MQPGSVATATTSSIGSPTTPVYHAVPLTPIAGKPAIEALVLGRSYQTAPRIVIHQQIAENNFVVNERTDHMTLNGRPVTLQICAVFENDNGRIKAWREYFDLGPAAAAYKGTSY